MYQYLTDLGIQEPSKIQKYTLRQEALSDVLKIYFYKQEGELFAKSIKLKYPRQKKTILVDSGTHQYKDVTEINRTLTLVLDELNEITEAHKLTEHDLQKKILSDLKHLEKVVIAKINEITHDVNRLHH
ncbi:DUF3461 family protein [Vibrio salinus]|uniref:DUF3461 family protein n=1 Tax=Vibrio salinus TaxID=2899784 RepID=UPI001E64C6CF|nr:DUF3461 family protein [Vibrio salinus]MCE0494379.1 DUF3461 family protein [Vibrio salinus]